MSKHTKELVCGEDEEEKIISSFCSNNFNADILYMLCSLCSAAIAMRRRRPGKGADISTCIRLSLAHISSNRLQCRRHWQGKSISHSFDDDVDLLLMLLCIKDSCACISSSIPAILLSYVFWCAEKKTVSQAAQQRARRHDMWNCADKINCLHFLQNHQEKCCLPFEFHLTHSSCSLSWINFPAHLRLFLTFFPFSSFLCWDHEKHFQQSLSSLVCK